MKLGVLFQEMQQTLSRRPLLHLTTLSILTGTFSICLIISSLLINMNALLSRWGKDVKMSVYLKDESPVAEIESLKKQIKAFDEVAAVEFISTEQAKNSFSEQMKNFAPELINDSELQTAFPSSLVLSFADKTAGSVLQTLAEKIKSFRLVESVSYGQEWLDTYSQWLGAMTKAGATVLIILSLSVLFIVGNSIQSSIAQRKDEVEILELIGATASRIRSPFIFEGAVLGLCSSALAVLISHLFFRMQSSLVDSQLSLLGVSSQFAATPWLISFTFCVFATLISSLGAYLCVARINSGWASASKTNQS
jgi:cell division transport system permease protein